MPTLGKCLVFAIKYAPEMNQLYWSPRQSGEVPEVHGIAQSDDVLKMIQAVGEAAGREVAIFLEACNEGIEQHFQSISVIRKVRKKLEVTWSSTFDVSPKA